MSIENEPYAQILNALEPGEYAKIFISENKAKLDQEIELNEQQKLLNEQHLILNDLEIHKRKKELQSREVSDQYIPVTREEVSELTGEDPFDRLELRPMQDLQQVADDVLDLGDVNVYLEIIAEELNDDTHG